MNKLKLLIGKISLTAFLSMGFVVLGIGFIFLALANILGQNDYPATTEYTMVGVNKESGFFLTLPMPYQPLHPEYTEKSVSAKLDSSLVLPPRYLSEGDNIGNLMIPALDQELPIIQGTGVEELKEGVGHFTQSVLPGEEDNCVLSGHRDTVFSKLGKLKIEDQLIVETSYGTYTYEIKSIRIVDKDDKTVIVPTDHAVLTLTTCYPFNFLGDAPDRYIVSADLVISKQRQVD